MQAAGGMADQAGALDAEPVHQREQVVGHVARRSRSGGSVAVAAAGAAMIVEDDPMVGRPAPSRLGAQ